MEEKSKSISFSENKLLIFASIAIVVYYLPYFILGENARITIHDNLDSLVAWVKVLADNNAIYGAPDTNIPNILNGLPLFNIYPYYDVSLLFFKGFGIYWGYVINKVLVSFIGFFGMFFLLKKHILPENYSRLILVGVSLLYGLLPYWSFMATVSGIPFVFYAFLNFRKRDYSYYNWLIIVLYAFYSSIILSGLFILIVLSILWLRDVIKTKKLNTLYILGLILLVCAYAASQFPMIHGFFEESVSHRQEFIFSSDGFFQSTLNTLKILIAGHYHAHSLQILIFVPIIFLLFYKNELTARLKIIVAFVLITSVFYGFIHFHYTQPLIRLFTDLIPIQLQRFHFLHPMIWYVLLGIGLSSPILRNSRGKKIAAIILAVQLIFIVLNHELIANIKMPTFKEFYSKSEFSRVKEIINKPVDSYKVISVGLHPAIAQFNGLNTLDGYSVKYPLNYKHQFRTVIQSEIERDEKMRLYFDGFGSRCYAFSSEIGLDFVSNDKKAIDTLAYNFEYLKELDCEYIISRKQINTSINSELLLMDSARNESSYWTLYVYKVNVGKE